MLDCFRHLSNSQVNLQPMNRFYKGLLLKATRHRSPKDNDADHQNGAVLLLPLIASGVLIQVEMKKALKEVYKDRETAPSFIEENVKYRFESEDDGYQQVVKHRSLSGSILRNRQTFHQERSNTGSEERSVAASQQYDITSWNKGNDASESSIIAVTGTERCGNEATTGAAWRAFINGWSSWTYERVGHDGTRKDASSSATLASCDHASTDTLPSCYVR
ncbi:hypothetical protein MRX96_013320 [Rhipicephalus microplus]